LVDRYIDNDIKERSERERESERYIDRERGGDCERERANTTITNKWKLEFKVELKTRKTIIEGS